MGDDAAGMAREFGEGIVFLAVQGDLGVASAQVPPRKIDGHLAGQDRRVAGLAAGTMA